jgi:predicted component of type VI protein secretion system
MAKNTNKFRELYHEYSDCLEYLATYGLSELNESEQNYARKLSEMSQEYIDAYEQEEQSKDDEKLDDDDE